MKKSSSENENLIKIAVLSNHDTPKANWLVISLIF